jgi:hypothetical protein
MKYDIEKRDELVKEQAPPESAGKETVPPERRCEDRVRYLEAVLQDMGDGVIVADRKGNVAYMNAAAMEMFGLRTPDEGTRYFRDTGRYEILDDAGRPLPQESWPLTRAMRGESFRDQEVTFKDKATGRLISGIYNAAPLKDAGMSDMNVITVHARTARKGALSVAPGLLPLLGPFEEPASETALAPPGAEHRAGAQALAVALGGPVPVVHRQCSAPARRRPAPPPAGAPRGRAP